MSAKHAGEAEVATCTGICAHERAGAWRSGKRSFRAAGHETHGSGSRLWRGRVLETDEKVP